MIRECTKCGDTKPLDEYHRSKSGKLGRHTHCKTCRSARRTERYTQNRESVRAQQREYSAANPELSWESGFRERALKYGFGYLIPSMQKVTREDLIRIHGDRCKHCGGPFESADHWPIAVSQGGHHAAYNMVPSCMDCQRRTWRAYKPSTNTTTDTTTKENI